MSRKLITLLFVLITIIGCGNSPDTKTINIHPNITKTSISLLSYSELLSYNLFYDEFFYSDTYDKENDTFFAIEYNLTLEDKFQHYSTNLPIVITCDNNFSYEYNYLESYGDTVIVYLSKEFLEAKGCLHVDNQPSSLQTQYLGDRDTVAATGKLYHLKSNIITITSQELQQQEQ